MDEIDKQMVLISMYYCIMHVCLCACVCVCLCASVRVVVYGKQLICIDKYSLHLP